MPNPLPEMMSCTAFTEASASLTGGALIGVATLAITPVPARAPASAAFWSWRWLR